MTHKDEELEKIIEQVLMKHHDDISKQDDDAIAEAVSAILSAGYVKRDKVRIDEKELWILLTQNLHLGSELRLKDIDWIVSVIANAKSIIKINET